MPLPGDLATVIVTGSFLDAAGDPLTGMVTFTPTVEVTDAAGRVVIPNVPQPCPLSGQGTFTSLPLAATDNTDLVPAWSYLVEVDLPGGAGFSFTCPLPHTPSPVDLSALI